MGKEKEELKVEDFNGKVVTFKQLPSDFRYINGIGNTDFCDLIGITFIATSDARPSYDNYIHCVIGHKNSNKIVFKRVLIDTIKISNNKVKKSLKKFVIDKIKEYHTNERYMTNLLYLEAIGNISKVGVIE